MATLFTYEASGNLSLSKCGIGYSNSPIFIRNVEFSVGDQAWLKYKAEKGKLESIIVKKINLIDFTYRGNGPVTVIYVDTFNALYNETDLISYSDALILKTNYLYNQRVAESLAGCLK